MTVVWKIHIRQKLEQKKNEKIKTIVKIQENFHQSMQQQIAKNIEETIQEELENNLDDSMSESTMRVFHAPDRQQDHDGSPDIVVTGVQNTSGLVNDPAEHFLHESNERVFERRQENDARRYHRPERDSYYDRPRRSRGGPRGRRGSYRARSRPYSGLPSRNFREEFPRRRNHRGHYPY